MRFALILLAVPSLLLAAGAFDANAAKNALRTLHAQLAAATPAQRPAIGARMLEQTTSLVQAEPDGLAGWLLHAEAAVAAKSDAAITEATVQLQRLHADTSGHPLAAPVLALLKAANDAPAGAAATAPATAAAAAATSGAEVPVKDRLKAQANGDKLLTPIPDATKLAETISDMDILTLTWMQKYFGWKADVKEIATKKKLKEDKTQATNYMYDFITGTLPQAAHVKLKTTDKFDRHSAARSLAQGKPLLVWRVFSEQRDKELLGMSQKHDTDPTATLPDPKSIDERKKWPVVPKKKGKTKDSLADAPYTTSIIYGMNEKTGEFIMLEPYEGPEYNHLRMTGEELEFVSTCVFVFD